MSISAVTAADVAADADLPRILLFAGRFAVRGTCRYTLRLAEGLPEERFRVSVVCPDAQRVDRLVRQQLKIVEFPYLQVPVWGHVVQELLYRSLKAVPPDLIHVQSRGAVTMGERLAHKLKKPMVLTVHDYLQPRERFQVKLSLCQQVIAVSESVKADLLSRTAIPEDRITVIHSGVECQAGPCKRPILDGTRVPVIGTAGPLEAVKGFPFFLGAAARVLATGRDVEFVIAGAGPEEESLRRLSRELGISDHVTFVPNLLDFSEAIQAMDIFCLPSLQQGIGTIMLEAMALGRPVIATRVGGVYRVVDDGVTGLLVPPSDSERLADRMLELLNDPQRAQSIGAAAQAHVHGEFGEERMVQQTAEVYRHVLDQWAQPSQAAPMAAVSAAS
jgi:glycosyltransferase involved in cell wall biosynthesis